MVKEEIWKIGVDVAFRKTRSLMTLTGPVAPLEIHLILLAELSPQSQNPTDGRRMLGINGSAPDWLDVSSKLFVFLHAGSDQST